MVTNLLAIDTSARTAGIALLDGTTVVEEWTWQARGSHTVHLLPAVQQLLKAAGLTPADVQAIGVAIGPGAFTGLRVGIATAKALAWSLSIPCLGISSLLALAAAAPRPARVLAVLDAGRGDWYWALYANERDKQRCLSAPSIGRPAEVLERVKRSTVLVGELTNEQRELITASPISVLDATDPRLSVARPAAVGLLALERLAAGERDEPATLQPVYLRRPAAEERKEVRAT